MIETKNCGLLPIVALQLLSIISMAGCDRTVQTGVESTVDTISSSGNTPSLSAPVIANASISNNILTIVGSNLASVTDVVLIGGQVNAPLSISNASNTSLTARVGSTVALAVGTVYNLLISNASATTTVSFSYDLTAVPVNGLVVGGTQLVTASGKVGIGTASPTNQLDIVNNSTDTSVGITGSTLAAGAGLGNIYFNNSGSTSGAKTLAIITASTSSSANTGKLGFRVKQSDSDTVGTEAMYIYNSGQIFAGPTAPTTGPAGGSEYHKGNLNVSGNSATLGSGVVSIRDVNPTVATVGSAYSSPGLVLARAGGLGVAYDSAVQFSLTRYSNLNTAPHTQLDFNFADANNAGNTIDSTAVSVLGNGVFKIKLQAAGVTPMTCDNSIKGALAITSVAVLCICSGASWLTVAGAACTF
ncbi:MAG: hypothetical protein ABIQ95_03065 [Bdellovibrionia bacterium]